MDRFDEFVDALLHCDTVKVILTGCGESVFETKEIYEHICKLHNENAELKAMLSNAVEFAKYVNNQFGYCMPNGFFDKYYDLMGEPPKE